MEDEAFLTIKSEPTATSAEAATPRSMFLITDIILVVTDVLRRKRDLKNLALCSKALLANVRPRLYREITVNTALLASRGGRSWDALIQPNNLGLLQIRSITVDYHSESEEHLVASAVEHLFTVIPPDTLTSFE